MAQAAGDRYPRDHGTIEELAAAEKINPSYISRVLRMTLLAPDIVEALRRRTASIGIETRKLDEAPFSTVA